MNNKTTYIQFTAGVGPTECALACEKVVRHFANTYIDTYYFKLVSAEENYNGGYRSAVIEIPDLTDEEVISLKAKWEGTVKYISTKNSIRPNHKRKNWFVGVNVFESVETIDIDKKDLKWETMRASGPGGQHINRTESAVRVTHIPTGVSVHCDLDRSQKQNKDTALKLLMAKINVLNNTKIEEHKNLIWMNHKTLERGNEIMTLKGEL